MEQTSLEDMFALEKEGWLDKARHEAKKLLARRSTITIEDVLEVCPRPYNLHRNTIGKVFNEEFYPVGFVKSRRAISKGRWIRQWRLKE